jgi:hypothetical protein
MYHELIRLRSGEPVFEKDSQQFSRKKLMTTIAWNTIGFHVFAALSKGTKFNSAYYTTEILGNIRKWRDVYVIARTQKLIVYADNGRSHTAKTYLEFLVSNGMVRIPYPPYSPDLAPFNFYLFSNVKR